MCGDLPHCICILLIGVFIVMIILLCIVVAFAIINNLTIIKT